MQDTFLINFYLILIIALFAILLQCSFDATFGTFLELNPALLFALKVIWILVCENSAAISFESCESIYLYYINMHIYAYMEMLYLWSTRLKVYVFAQAKANWRKITTIIITEFCELWCCLVGWMRIPYKCRCTRSTDVLVSTLYIINAYGQEWRTSTKV